MMNFQHSSSSTDIAAGFEHRYIGGHPPSPSSLPPYHYPPRLFFYGTNGGHQQFQRFYPSPLPYFHQAPPPQQYFHQTPPPQQFIRPTFINRSNFRDWQYASSEQSSNEKFTVVSYNILADYLASKHRDESYSHIPPHILDWELRCKKIIWELGLWAPDIICLQEVDRFQDLVTPLNLRGYVGIWKKRTGVPVDGCAIFWKMERFELLHEECIEFNKLGLRDNIAQICVFKSKIENDEDDSPNHVVVCNIHVLWNPNRGDVKLGQVRVLLNRAHDVSKMWNNAPVVVCGDFNSTPNSPLYEFISKQKLDLVGMARDKISGQSDAQIGAPEEMYNPSRSLWTRMAIETASGNGECNVVEHQLKLKSAYTQLEHFLGTRDLMSKEPQVTCYNRKFIGTVDYIWCSEELETVKVLKTISKESMLRTSFGFPTIKWGSDHMAMASQLAFKKR